MGLSNTTQGLVTGFSFFVVPQLLAAEQVPEAKIAAITAMAVSPNFWAVMFSPMLDVRFSRRWYAAVFAAATAALVAISILNLHHLLILEITLTLGVATAALSGAALGGWLATVASPEDKNALSKWMNIALTCGIGIASVLGGELVRHLPILLAAAVLGALVLLPAAIFIVIPAPGPDRRLAAESFGQFNRDVLALLRRRNVVIALLLFLSPCSSFALANLLGGLGADFHASARAVSLAGGTGAIFPGILGCLLFPIVARRLPLRLFYFGNGILGSLFTLSLIVLPHVPWTFTLAVLGEYLFQAVAFAIQLGIVFEVIGESNPLAATTYAFLTAATNVPVIYMMLVDGHAYSVARVAGAFTTDALIGIVTCLLAGILLARFDSKASTSRVKSTQLIDAMQEDI
jgi:PAT family beta-lactamase induction signal transducer AmpG